MEAMEEISRAAASAKVVFVAFSRKSFGSSKKKKKHVLPYGCKVRVFWCL